MTIKGSSMGDAGDLREQAAAWFARMRGPDSNDARTGFEAWLAADPLHREAYSRIAEVFSLGKGLSDCSESMPKPVLGTARGTLSAFALVALLAMSVGGSMLLRQGSVPTASPKHLTANAIAASRTATLRGRFQTAVGQIRQVHLADGSSVILDTNSILGVSFDGSRRQLRLVQGRARFDVAHETRPFVVLAAAGTVTAHGTMFDVTIRENRTVRVRLIRGAIDVALPGVRRPRKGMGVSEQLRPGQQIVVTEHALLRPQEAVGSIDDRWPNAELDCDHFALSEVAARANRYSATQIVLGEPALGMLQISGTFRIDNTDQLALHLAQVFDLQIERQGSTRLVLHK